MEILLLCVLALHAICQPYTKKVHNIVDTLLFTNLAIISAISFANYHQKQHNHGNKMTKSTSFNMSVIFQLILIYLPAAVLIIYIISVLCKSFLNHKIKKTSSSEEPQTNNTSSSKVSKLKFLLNSLGSSSGEKGSQEEEELPHRLVADHNDANHFRSDNTTSMAVERETTLDATY